MATPANATERATMQATARQLAATGASHRAIGRQLGVHHSTVKTWLATPAETATRQDPPPATRHEPPVAPATVPTPASVATATNPPVTATWTPPPLTSGDKWWTELLRRPPAWLVQDLNVLLLNGIPEQVAAAIHQAANRQRAIERAADDAADRQEAAATRHETATGDRQPATTAKDAA